MINYEDLFEELSAQGKGLKDSAGMVTKLQKAIVKTRSREI